MAGDSDQPRRPRRPRQAGGRRPALTHAQVITAALAIIDADGVDALTMRRLGKALGRDPMRIYRHAADKNALLDSVIEHVAAELITAREIDSVNAENWQAVLRDIAHTFRRVALAHPRVVPLMLTRPLSGPLALRPRGTLQLLEELIEVFSVAGLDSPGALHAARLFTGFLYGHVLHELQEQIDNPHETDDLLRLGLHQLPITEFPRLRSLATVLGEYDGAAELDAGLDIVLAGLRSQLSRW